MGRQPTLYANLGPTRARTGCGKGAILRAILFTFGRSDARWDSSTGCVGAAEGRPLDIFMLLETGLP